MANSNSLNDVKQVKAIQQVSNIQALRLIAEMKQHLQTAGGLKSVMRISKNFAYSLSETKFNDSDLPTIKVGKKRFYLSPVGQVNECNVLNVIKSVLKVEDAKRILAKKLAKKLTFAQFCETTDAQKRLDDVIFAAKIYGGIDLSEKQKRDNLHSFYNEYLHSLGLDE